jgi:hypothetical protein
MHYIVASHKEVIINLSRGVNCFQMTTLCHAATVFDKQLVR